MRVVDTDVCVEILRGNEELIVFVTGNRHHYERVPDLQLEDWIR